MERKTGIVKIMGCLSSALLIFLLIGYMSSHNMDTTVNYCFSDQSELEGFELKLEKENISFSQISDTTVNISKDNEEQVDTIFYQITNNTIDSNWCIEYRNECNRYCRFVTGKYVILLMRWCEGEALYCNHRYSRIIWIIQGGIWNGYIG